MAYANGNYCNLQETYLFTEIANRVNAYTAAHPEKKIIRLGIGDVTLPLAPIVIDALHKAVDEMGAKETFRGYGPEQGYDFLRQAIVNYYAQRGVELAVDEIFVSDGAKSDCGNIGDIFADANTMLIQDPVYPVYLDTNIMRGRKVIYMDATVENNFTPMPDNKVKADIIYLCSPSNPTGSVYTKEQLQKWVDYALSNDAIILYDSAYESFVDGEKIPHSIFSVPDAKKCAIEFNSFSKIAGFTGTRCGYVVVPKGLERKAENGKVMNLNAMWLRRQTTKFNGVPYIVQRAAEAALSEEGLKQCWENIAYYKENAQIMMKGFDECGIKYYGGVHSPYLWVQCPNGMKSWEFFDNLLAKANVVGTPGCGFGVNGEGFLRLTSFGSRENTIEAMQRIVAVFKNKEKL